MIKLGDYNQGRHFSFFRGEKLFRLGETQTWPGLVFRLHVQAQTVQQKIMIRLDLVPIDYQCNTD